ncbi:SAV_6107 family HEPN domain-containing protein [Natronoglycomyces albus]|uniref:SAV-6107-like HEPN domain-containing protein n=1 Tax=Natronoglycomyces albus TaxID=2811108 RepID=A0A895XK06_9ACTN|nr:SAV_6107 family HEPN domain-containing protein [Natronoglycomyces albus]QSB03893.1 hypothetical protein JQS30_08630 [Natronoglycomyces albus]
MSAHTRRIPTQTRRRPVRLSATRLPDRSPLQLLRFSRQELAAAAEHSHPGLRYATAHLAALRAAAAVLVVHSGEDCSPGRVAPLTDTWSLLESVAPELGEWASFFTLTARKRVRAQSGVPGVVTRQEADDLILEVRQFQQVVTRMLGFATTS